MKGVSATVAKNARQLPNNRRSRSEVPSVSRERRKRNSMEPNASQSPDAWESPQRILVMLAHPDDPEFFCGATLARWARAGHRITYQLLTCGDKGFNDSTPADMTTDALCAMRH